MGTAISGSPIDTLPTMVCGTECGILAHHENAGLPQVYTLRKTSLTTDDKNI